MNHLLTDKYLHDYILKAIPKWNFVNPTIPKISIITSFYNGNELIYDLAKSLFAQTFQDFEWVIVNDGSTKAESLAILNNLVSFDKRIRIVHHATNKGLPAGRNTGIGEAKGNYLFFIDADDLLDLTAFEKFYLFLELNSHYSFVNSYVVGFGNQNYLWNKGFEKKEDFLNSNYNTATFLSRREVFDKICFDETIKGGYEDWDFWLKAASSGFWGYTIPEYLFWYRRNDHEAKWDNWKSHEKITAFTDQLKKRYTNAFATLDMYHHELNKNYQVLPVCFKPVQPYKAYRSKKKKVVFLFPWLNLGGADKFNLDIVEGLSQMDWEISILTTLKSSNPWQENFEKYTHRIFHMPNLAGCQDYLHFFELYLQSNKPDLLVISNSMHGYFSLPFLKYRFPDIPVVDYIHCEDPDWLNGGYPRLNTVYAHLLDKTIVSSIQLKNWINKKRIPGRQQSEIEVCYTNIDTNKIYRNISNRKTLRGEWKVHDDFAVILFAARLTDQKQPYVLVDTIDRLARLTDNFICIVCGDGPHFDGVKKKIEQLNLVHKIWMMGALKHHQVLELMDASDIFFLPSKYEGIALTLFESMAKELLVVGSDVGGQKELVSEDCGFLIEPSVPEQEAKEYADILFKMVASQATRTPFTKRALARLKENFALSEMVARMDQLLTGAIVHHSISENEICPEDFAFLYNAFWNKDLTANEVWEAYVYTKKQLTSDIATSGMPLSASEQEWIRGEYMKLKEWYNEQYEVLPGWYKRFGHVIKVVTGKRKFSSLFK